MNYAANVSIFFLSFLKKLFCFGETFLTESRVD